MGRSIALLAACLAAITPIPAEADAGATFDYLYVESNEGDSSGGHVAIRTGPKVYHFQNKDALWRAAADRIFGQLRKDLGEQLAGVGAEDARERSRRKRSAGQ